MKSHEGHVAVSKSLVVLASDVAQVEGQLAGKEEDSETSDESGPLPVPKSARAVSGRRHHRLRMLVDHLMCRDAVGRIAPGAKSCEDTRRTRNHQTALGTFLKFGKERAVPLVVHVKIDDAWLRIRTIALSREFSITMVHSF